MRIEESVTILASRERIWEVLIDVEHWHEWTASITSIQKLDGAPLSLGSKVRIRQPRLREAIWAVTVFDPPNGFVWESHAIGVHSTGEHWITQLAAGECHLVLKFLQTGLLSPVLSPFFAGLTRRYVQMESNGLKARCET